jgi:hypothetical protein
MRGGKREGAGRKPNIPNRRTRALQERVEASGMSPLDFLLSVMRNPKAKMAVRIDCATRAAPFVHAKLTAVERSGKDGGPMEVEVKQYSDIEAARLIGRFLTKVGASHNGDSGK